MDKHIDASVPVCYNKNRRSGNKALVCWQTQSEGISMADTAPARRYRGRWRTTRIEDNPPRSFQHLKGCTCVACTRRDSRKARDCEPRERERSPEGDRKG